MQMRICTNLSGDKLIKRRACKFKNFHASLNKSSQSQLYNCTVMLIMKYLFIANVCCCFHENIYTRQKNIVENNIQATRTIEIKNILSFILPISKIKQTKSSTP